MQVDWSPDGERLVVATFGWNIYLINKDSTNKEWLVQDGKWMAFYQPFYTWGFVLDKDN